MEQGAGLSPAHPRLCSRGWALQPGAGGARRLFTSLLVLTAPVHQQ